MRRELRAGAGLLLALLLAGRASAVCNAIPAATDTYRGVLGSLNRPFASPGDFVGVEVRNAICDFGSPGFTEQAADYVVTVLFTPPAGAANAVVLAGDCAEVTTSLGACHDALAPGGGAAVCQSLDAASLFVRDQKTRVGLPRRQLFFRFPDTSGVFPLSAGHTLAGPAKVIVTRRGEALACGIADGGCAGAPAGPIACVDTLFQLDGSCEEDVPGDVDPLFGSFTALPPPNDFEDLCEPQSDPVCDGSAADLLVTTDAAGNLLVPFDYSGVLAPPGPDGFSVARLGRLDTQGLETSAGSGTPITLTDPKLLSSHAPEGLLLLPAFTPLLDSAGPSLFGTLDARRGVVRIAPSRQACSGGTAEGELCSDDADCPLASCERAPDLFDFRDRYADAGTGPVPIPPPNYELRAETPLQLSGIRETPTLFTAVVEEGGKPEIQIVDKGSGEIFPLGLGVSRQASDGFLSPIIAAAGDKVVAMVSEAREAASLNRDNDASDAIVMAFSNGSTVELTSGLDVADTLVDPLFPLTGLPVGALDNRALRIENGLAWFATAENLAAKDTRLWVSQAFGGGPANGPSRHARSSGFAETVFESTATNLLDPARSGLSEIYLFVPPDFLGIVSGDTPDGDAFAPDITPDGRFVAFESGSSTLVAGDTNAAFDVFVLDRDTSQTERVNVTSSEVPTNGAVQSCLGGDPVPVPWGSREASLSPDGRYVLFSSEERLASADVNNASCLGGSPAFTLSVDVYLRDRLLGTTELVSATEAGTSAVGTVPGLPSAQAGLGSILSARRHPAVDADDPLVLSLGRRISNDGRYVVFDSLDPLVANDDAGSSRTCFDAYLRDRFAGDTILLSETLDPSWEAQGCLDAVVQEISQDGTRVLFWSRDPGLLAPEERRGCALDPALRTAESCPGAVLELDVATRKIRLVSRGIDGRSAGPLVHGGFFVDEGDAQNDFVLFFGDSQQLAEDDADAIQDGFVGDDITGVVFRGVTTPQYGSYETLSFDGPAAVCTEEPVRAADDNGVSDVEIALLEYAPNAAQDLEGDGDLGDGVLRVFDLEDPGTVRSIRGFGFGSVAPDGAAVFLRDERDTGSGVRNDLNGDGDAVSDRVAFFHPGRSSPGGPLAPESAAVGLDRAVETFPDGEVGSARYALAVSDSHVAALVSERDQGSQDRNGDTDLDDGVLEVSPRGGAWVKPLYQGRGLSANGLLLRNDVVGFSASEPGQKSDLNGDGDQLDGVAFFYFAGPPQLVPTGLEVQDGVLGDAIAAFRTSESGEGQDLNGDGDLNDSGMIVFDYATKLPVPTGSSAVPCGFEVCDPAQPYRVKGRTVRFLTREQDEGRDLNDDFDLDDLVVQLFNLDATAPAQRLQVVATVEEPVAADPTSPAPSPPIDPLADPPFTTTPDESAQIVTTRGVCESPDGSLGSPCNSDADCLVEAGQACDLGEVATAGSADADADGIPDALDNCPLAANAGQQDTDLDRVGDACDRATCGNGSLETGEACDDGNLVNGDGCSQLCRVAGCVGDVNLDGKVGAVDLALIDDAAGCFPCASSCAAQCDMNGDGRVNNADVWKLQDTLDPEDPPEGVACAEPVSTPSVGSGSSGGCGIGPELGLLLAPLLAVWRGRRAR